MANIPMIEFDRSYRFDLSTGIRFMWLNTAGHMADPLTVEPIITYDRVKRINARNFLAVYPHHTDALEMMCNVGSERDRSRRGRPF